ncbi:MAG: large subunit ribosomal protein L29 [Verrucomicrobiales bacterium]|jgi:large subunit ribosomal protein L29
MNKITELRELTSEEMIAKRRDLKHEILNLRVQQQSGQLENTALLRNNRREIGRLETILSERRLRALDEPAVASASVDA